MLWCSSNHTEMPIWLKRFENLAVCHSHLLSGSGDSYVAASGLFSRDPATGAKRLGGFDPDHAKKMIGFAKAMLWVQQVPC